MYTQNINSKWTMQCTAITLLVLTLSTPSAYAVPSGTSVDNFATVSFEVNNLPQADALSGTASFVVDKKVDLTVTTSDLAVVVVTPGDSVDNTVLEYSVMNTGNDTQDFGLSAIAVTTSAATRWDSETDVFDAIGPQVFVENGATPNFQPSQDSAQYIDELATGNSQTVYIVSTIPLTAANGQYASYHLLAEALSGGTPSTQGSILSETSNPDTPGTVDIVFADGGSTNTLASDIDRDAKHSSQNDYRVAAANISVSKTSLAIWDPVNLTVNPKRIPDGRVEYTITVSNAASASTATNITVTDDLSGENTDIIYYPDGYAVGQGISLSINGAPATLLTGPADTDAGTYDGPSQILTVSGITLNGGDTAIIRFQVTIQ